MSLIMTAEKIPADSICLEHCYLPWYKGYEVWLQQRNKAVLEHTIRWQCVWEKN